MVGVGRGDTELVPRRPEVVAATALYVVPLLLTSAFLISVGLPVLGVALLVIEAGITGCVVLARRRPARPVGDARPTTDGSTFLLVMGGGVVVVALLLAGVLALTS